MQCEQVGCERPAFWSFLWPGRSARQAACLMCGMKAKTIAAHLGFVLELGDLTPIIQQRAAEVVEALREPNKPTEVKTYAQFVEVFGSTDGKVQ